MDPRALMGLFGGSGGGGMESIISGLFGHSERPFEKGADYLQGFLKEAQGKYNPFYNAGVGAVGDYQKWLKGMSDPSQFINTQMNNYTQSPWAKYLTDTANRAGMNAASASGLTGSTPFAQQLQQNASNIASGDMNSYLQNVMGVNNTYGSGLNNLMQGGLHSADSMANLLSLFGPDISRAMMGKFGAQNSDRNSVISGLFNLFNR